jgi:hypothetical protein
MTISTPQYKTLNIFSTTDPNHVEIDLLDS